MQKKTTLWSIGALFFVTASFAQTIENQKHSHLTCGTPDVSLEEFRAPIIEAARIRTTKKASTKGTIYIPIKMHLIGNNDQTDFADENAVNDMLAELNKIYKANQNIEFFFKGTSFSKYADTHMNHMSSYAEEQEFHNTHGAPDAINFYVKRSLRGTGGYSHVTPTKQVYNKLFVVTGQLNDNKTTPHEFGHYFGLSHTFQNSNANNNGTPDYNKRELVTRNPNEVNPRISANCSRTGDFLCDTEADPYGSTGASSSNCIVNAPTDANGDHFHPNMGNYMNYYWCPNYSFTPQQISKMQDSYLIMEQKTDFFDATETQQTAPSDLNTTVGIYQGPILLSWKDNSDVETGYIIEIAEKGTDNFIPIAGVKADTESYKLLTLPDLSKEYVFRVKASNSTQNYSPTSESFKMPKLCADLSSKNCIVGNPAPVINNFTLTIDSTEILTNLNTGCTNQSTANYYDSHQAKVTSGSTVKFKVQPMYGSGGSYYPFDMNIYCDWNNDGDFEDENELINDSMRNRHTAIGTFTIPQNIDTGIYRLRAVMTYKGNALTSCDAKGGEIEDYALIVEGNTLSTSQQTIKDETTIYPNPATKLLYISSAKNWETYTIYDMSGRKLKSGIINTNSINIEPLDAGTYTLSVHTRNGETSNIRFIKKK